MKSNNQKPKLNFDLSFRCAEYSGRSTHKNRRAWKASVRISRHVLPGLFEDLFKSVTKLTLKEVFVEFGKRVEMTSTSYKNFGKFCEEFAELLVNKDVEITQEDIDKVYSVIEE